ncbi:MAG: sensor histidine kinase, partial [Planctomycetota bacterium]
NVAFIAHGVISTSVVCALLVYRAWRIHWQQRRAQELADDARREADAQRERAEEQSELLTMLTHELRTPLSVVRLALADAGQGPAMRERANRAMRNMNDVIEKCAQTALYDHDLSHRDAPPETEVVAIVDVVAHVVGSLQQWDRVLFRSEDDLLECDVDPKMLQVIVGNLLENALKYSPPDGAVELSLAPAEREGRAGATLRVTNQIGPAGRPDPAHVFEKYHRGAGARHGSGSGLGLYLAQRLSSRLGGAVQLCAADDQDQVTFELWVPSQPPVRRAAIL